MTARTRLLDAMLDGTAVRRATATTAVAAALVLGVGAGARAAAEDPDPGPTHSDPSALDESLADDTALTAGDYPGNAATEPSLVADEEERLAQVRTVASMIRWRDLDVDGPYRLSTGSTYTLVLTKREVPYTIADLLTLAPQTFVREPDGAYMLTENIVVQPGATLALSDAGELTLRLASDAERFVSIVNFGGDLVTRGTSAAPVTITSWDRDAGAPDTATEDGRAYVRSVGGRVELEGTTFSDLGFWSGRTGGVALTGTDLPSGGELDEFGRTLRDAVNANDTTPDPLTQEERRALEDAGQTVPDDAVGDGAADGMTGDAAAEAPFGGGVEGLLPAGELPVPVVDPEDPSYSYVSARIEDCLFVRNAFGLFVSSANGVDISGSAVTDSLVDGLVMHRFVVNAVVSRTVSKDNTGAGFILARATTGITLSEVEATGNGGTGIELRGEALADGPNATGMPVGSYGNNSVANSLISDNGRYGIEVVGGRNVNVNANDVARNDMGIVVRDGASDVSVVGNRVAENLRHGIALRNGVSEASVTGNVVSDGPTAIYLRDSSAVVERNTVSGVTNHAVSLVGEASGTVVAENTLAGRGPSAVDGKRADGEVVRDNDTSEWTSTKPFWTVVRNALQPLTVMWLLLALVVVVTALRGGRRRASRSHPYVEQRRLAELVEPGTAFRVLRDDPENPRILVGATARGEEGRMSVEERW